MCKFLITRLDKTLPLPKYMTEQAAGIDLYSTITKQINPGTRELIPTGIKISLPKDFEAQIRPRSGLALKHGITVLNSPGTIDSDYRGEILIILINHGTESFEVKRGERIAQMVINRIERVQFEETDELDETIRNDGGFGHTV